MTPDSPATGPGNEALARLLLRAVLDDYEAEFIEAEGALPWRNAMLQAEAVADHTAAAVSEARDAAVGGLVATFKQVTAVGHLVQLLREPIKWRNGQPIEWWMDQADAEYLAGRILDAGYVLAPAPSDPEGDDSAGGGR